LFGGTEASAGEPQGMAIDQMPRAATVTACKSQKFCTSKSPLIRMGFSGAKYSSKIIP
jgi:hypothetical protein